MSWIKFRSEVGSSSFFSKDPKFAGVPYQWVPTGGDWPGSMWMKLKDANARIDEMMKEKTFLGAPKYRFRDDAERDLGMWLRRRNMGVIAGDSLPTQTQAVAAALASKSQPKDTGCALLPLVALAAVGISALVVSNRPISSRKDT